MSLPLIQRNYQGDQYGWQLSSLYHSGWRVPDPEFATGQDADIYEKLRRDPDIAAALNKRFTAVAGRHWTLTPPRSASPDEKKLALILEDLVLEIEKFTSGRYELATAILRGSSWAYLCGRRRVIKAGPDDVHPMVWWTPAFLKDVDKRRFRYGLRRLVDPSTGKERIETPLELWSVVRQQWERVDPAAPLVRMVVQDEESRLGAGRGLIEALYFYYFIKGKVLEEGLSGVERWANGMVVVSIDGLRENDYTRTNTIVKNAVKDAIKKVRSRHFIVKDKQDDIEVKESSGTGHEMVMEFLHELNRAMRVLILGADMIGGGSRDTGSTEMANTEKDMSDELVAFDQDMLSEAITKHVVRRVFWYNRANFEALGLLNCRLPKFNLTDEQHRDPEKEANVFATLKGAGLSLRADEVYDHVGYTKPEEDDETIDGADPLAAMLGPGGEGAGGFGKKPPFGKPAAGDDEEGDGAEDGAPPFQKKPDPEKAKQLKAVAESFRAFRDDGMSVREAMQLAVEFHRKAG